ncbi:MAG: LPS assembly protein LptD [Rhodocyclaceae bacterium]
MNSMHPLRGRLAPLFVCCVSGAVLPSHAEPPLVVAETMPPLLVDPALLGLPAAQSPGESPTAEVAKEKDQAGTVPATPAGDAKGARPAQPPASQPATAADKGVPADKADAGISEPRAKPLPNASEAPSSALAPASALPVPLEPESKAPVLEAAPAMRSTVAPIPAGQADSPATGGAGEAAKAAAEPPDVGAASMPPAKEPASTSAASGAAPVAPESTETRSEAQPATVSGMPQQAVRTPLSASEASSRRSTAKGEKHLPTFLTADRVHATGPNETIAEGNSELRRAGKTLFADKVTYWQDEDEAEAVGNVVLTQAQDRISGPKLRLKLGSQIGFFETPDYSMTRTPEGDAAASVKTGKYKVQRVDWLTGEPLPPVPRPPITATGSAERMDFEGENHYRMKNATYSTCTPDKYDWYAKGETVVLDYDREVGEAKNMTLRFKDVPFFYAPWADFSLSGERKSGFLAPTFGSSNRTGLSLIVPYYWNIAPDLDATIAPRIMTRRGLQLGGELRYLDAYYRGELHGEYLPRDQVTGQSRSAYSWSHAQKLPYYGFSASAKVAGVSDDTYFTDLGAHTTTTSQTNLLRQGTLSYGGAWWSTAATVQRYQTLQDPAKAAVTKPYDKLPQLTLTASRPDERGFGLSMTGDYTDFHHPTLDKGRRLVMYPQVSYPIEGASYFVRPKIGLHYTRYNLDRQTSTGPDNITRSVPIASVDSGLIFERQANWFGHDLTQTLEPRLYYLNVPSRDQSQIPLFDTGLADYNFAQIFSENIFSGSDRIADANQLTAAVTSRLVTEKGVEVIRGAIGQRLYFRDQTVTLPGVAARTDNTADILAALSGKLTSDISIDTAWQYNPHSQATQRAVVAGRYQPGVNRLLNASYRFQRDVLKEIDISGQWPVYRGWYGVGRYNYSLREKRLIEAIAGFEYNGGCWVGRFVFQRFATNAQTATTSFFVQLELNGFSNIGSNPLNMLARRISGYGQVSASASDPVFGDFE